MKKFLEVLVIVVVVLGISFGFLAVNPQWGISQKILPLFTANTPAGTTQATGIDLTNCVSYFDGCNNCSVKDGKADACTEMYCETPSTPKCLEYATAATSTGNNNQGNIFATTDTYVVKTQENKTSYGGGYDIYVYDKTGNILLSLPQSGNDPQYPHEISGNYLVVEYGMGPVTYSMKIYDIRNHQEIFHSEYSYQDKERGEGLYIQGNKVYFALLVFDPNESQSPQRKISKPKELPTCAKSDLTIGYSELRIFNLDTKQLEKTGKLICTFVQ